MYNFAIIKDLGVKTSYDWDNLTGASASNIWV